jgi:hypothetical protein
MKTQTKTFKNQVYTFWSLVTLIVVAMALYIYFVQTTIFHTAERQQLQEMIIDTKSAISQLELELIEANREVTQEYALALGFVDVANTVFVERNTNSGVSLSRNERTR